jgi:[pyruvate, water dikinase]-phosphate phosphotransferase / [pyruvate, water dikinase] kinase
MSQQRTAFFISDGTGITAQTLGQSLLTQFPDAHFREIRIPFVTDRARALDCARQIRIAAERDGVRPIVFSTLVNPESVAGLREADALFIDLFEQFIGPLEAELDMRSTHAVGRFHGIAESSGYPRTTAWKALTSFWSAYRARARRRPVFTWRYSSASRPRTTP